MDTLVLAAETREQRGTGACSKMRRAGLVPAVVYGRGQDPVSISVPAKALWDTLHTHQGANVLVDLQISGLQHAGAFAAMVIAVQRDPVKRQPIHVDFQWVSLTEKVTVRVPIHVVGDSPGVKEGGAVDQVMHEIEVECLPTSIPDALIVSIEGLNISESQHVSDLIAPEGVVILHELTDTVISIAIPISAAALETEAPEAEVIEVGEGAAEVEE